MTPRQRRLHDLHRVATHSNLAIQETPMSAFVSRTMRSLIETGAFCQGPDTRPGLMINGGGCQGKTETACEALACYEDEWLALYAQNPSAAAGTLDLHVPAVYVRTPVRATPISLCQRILDFYGEPHKGMRLEDLLRTVKSAVFDHGTKAIVIDDVTRLKLHREADQDVLDLIRELMSLPVTLILVGVGIPKSGLLRDGRKDPRTGQWIFPPVKDRGKSRNDDAPGQTDLRFERHRPRPVQLRRPGRPRCLDRPPRRHRAAAPPPERLRRHAQRRRHARVPVRPHQRHHRAAQETHPGGMPARHRDRRQTITAGLLDTLTVSPADLYGLDPGAARSRHSPAPARRPGKSASRGTPSSTTGAPQPAELRADRRCPHPGRCPGAWSRSPANRSRASCCGSRAG